MLMDAINAWGGVVGSVVGVIGIILSVFFYFRSKSKKLLGYRIRSTQLITKKMISIPNLKVTINDQPIESLISTTIKFINYGNQSIEYSDFADKAPLGITITGHLYGNDVSTDNPNSDPSIQPFDGNAYQIKFDFLKPKQSFSISILHSGELKVLGELKAGILREQGDNSRYVSLALFIRDKKMHIFKVLVLISVALIPLFPLLKDHIIYVFPVIVIPILIAFLMSS